MPSTIPRATPRRQAAPSQPGSGEPRVAVLTAGRVGVWLQLAATDTADRLWRALPLHGTAETWGSCVHFEVPIKTGRDRTSRVNGIIGEIYFWTAEDRIVVPFGRTPISRPRECRLPHPCNVWALALDDVAALVAVQAGEKISLTAPPRSA